jgi:hypothetical protein
MRGHVIETCWTKYVLLSAAVQLLILSYSNDGASIGIAVFGRSRTGSSSSSSSGSGFLAAWEELVN